MLPQAQELRQPLDPGFLSRENSAMSDGSQRPGHPRAGAVSVEERDDEPNGSKKEGFEITVLVPQLLLRLFPPLMLLQLLPDVEPRVDHLTFSSGLALIALGRYTWQSYLLGLGVFVVAMSLPAATAAAAALVGQCTGRDGAERQTSPKAILFCIAGLALGLWDILLKHADQRAVNGVHLQQDPWDSATFFTGMCLVLFVLFAWLLWFIDTLWANCQRAPDVSLWTKPRFTNWDVFWVFVERFPLGDVYVARPQEGSGILKLKADINNDGWTEVATIELSRALHKGPRLERLRQLCKEAPDGVLMPVQVQTVVPVSDGWCVEWERYDRIKHAQLCLSISSVPETSPPRLTLSADGARPADWIGHGGTYCTGYRVTIDPVPPPDALEGNPEGDYLHDGSVVTMDRSLTGGRPRPLEFTESRSKRKLLYDEGRERKWIIARPNLHASRMSQEIYSRRTYHDHDWETEQPDGDWRQTGPPVTAAYPWVRAPHPELSGDRRIGQSRPASPERRSTDSALPAATALGRDPSVAPTMCVNGFVTAAYEISFPRRVSISFKALLGATVKASDQVEFLILQIELFFYSMLQFFAIYFILHVYAINKQVVQSQSRTLMDPDLWTELVSSTTILSDAMVKLIKDDLLKPTSPNREDAHAMRLASSEVLLPTAMYVFVCIVSASEHAMWSGADTLSESREDRWYRRALKDSAATGDSSLADIRSRASRNRGTVVLTIALFFIGVLSVLVALISSDEFLWAPGVASLFFCFICLGNVLGYWRRLADAWYRLVLYIFLFVRSCCFKRECDSPSSAKKAFAKELQDTDNSLRALHSMDKRDSVRKHELMLTYIESPMWDRFRAHGPDGFIRHFRGIDDAVISTDLEKLQQDMRVFLVTRSRENDLRGSAASNDDLVRQRSDGSGGDRYRNGVPIFDGTGRLEEQNSSETCVSAGHIADMIIGLSKARRLVHTSRNMRLVLLFSALHAFVPVWHSWLPRMFGGGCGLGQDEPLWNHGNITLGVSYDVGKLLACSESWYQVGFHAVCAFLNMTLSYSILNRLVKCRADYYARYLHMLYFIQLTPWSNLRTEKLKDHWGFLPHFNLDTPGNIEAWNKLRLYLQSWQIKTSRYKQVSVLWCFVGVILLALTKIVEMAIVHAQHDPDTENDYGCDIALLFAPNQTVAQQQCDEIFGCKWVPEDRDVASGTVWRAARCVLDSVNLCTEGDTKTVYSCLNRNHNDPKHQICNWDIGKMECEMIEQHFDTMSLFVVMETLIIGIGLLVTLWQGMLSNEIKREAFPHVIRHKHSELLSNSMHFVTERAQWERHRRYWREAEVKLLALVHSAPLN